MTQPVTGSNYTAAEIQAAVTQLVQSSITYPLDTLGVRRTDTTFGNIQQAAAGIFILYPNSPFYVIKLGLTRVQDQVADEATTLDALLAAVQVLGRNVLPVTDVSPLFSIQASLQALASAAASRTTSSNNIQNAPAYQQFSTASSSFLKGPAGQAVKQNGNIVQTPQQAVAAIPALLTQLAQSHPKLVATVQSLVDGVENYNALNLPNVVSSSVLSNAASLVGQDAAALNSLTPVQRLASVRTVILNLLATQAVVNTYGSFNGASDFYTLTGLGTPYSDLQHAAAPATSVSTFGGAFSFIAGISDDLSLQVDGTGPTDIYLNPSLVAVIKGGIQDNNFLIGNGTLPTADASPPFTPTPNNNYFYVNINATPYTINLTRSVDIFTPRTADQVAADINGVLPSTVRASSYYSPLKFSGLMVIPAGSDRTFTLLLPGSANFGPPPAGLGVNVWGAGPPVVGDSVDVLTGPNVGSGSFGGRYPVIAVAEVLGSWQVTVLGTTVADPSALVEIGAASRCLQIACVAPNTQVPAETSIVAYSQDAISQAALTTLGLPNNATFQCLKTRIDALVTDINAKTGRVTAGTLFGPTAGPISTAHADPSNATHIVFSAAETLGNAAFASTTLTYTVTSITVAGTISTGDTIALRSGASPGHGYSITTVNGVSVEGHPPAVGDIIVATGTFMGVSSSAVDAEFGPTLNAAKYQTVVITGGPSAGTYFVSGPGQTAIDVLLSSPLSTVNSQTSPTTGPLVLTASFGSTYLTLASKNTTTASEVIVGGLAAGQLYSDASPLEAFILASVVFVGTQGTFTVTTVDDAGNISVGDALCTSTTGGSSATYIIQSINGSTTSTNHPVTVTDVIVALGTVGGPLAPGIAITKTDTTLGTTSWFKLPSIPRGLQAGDLLEFYDAQYNVPSSMFPILGVNSSLSLIQVGPDELSGALIQDGTSWQFTTQPVPFAMLRVGTVNDFTYIQGLLQDWLDLPENQPLYLTNMNRLINPLLVGTPTAEQVQAAMQAITALYQFLTTAEGAAQSIPPTATLQSIIPLYTVESVPAIDSLISTYIAKGSDAAVDILLQGQFSSFFGLTDETSSYSGAFQASMRAVAMNDLPVRKINRPETQSAQLIGQATSPDFEYVANSVSESLQGEQTDPNTAADAYGQPSQYGITTGSSGAGGNASGSGGNNPNGNNTRGGPT